MNHRILTIALAALLCGFLTGTSQAQDQTPLAANLFYNYYTQGAANQVNAQMYLAPRPVPAYVGHSYYTYQPLMPHEHMYTHSRNYYNWYAGPEALYSSPCGGQCGGGCGSCLAARGGSGGALNKTTVRWYSGCNHVGPLLSGSAPLTNIQARMANFWLCPETAKRALEPRFSHLRGKLGGCLGGNCGIGGGCADGSCGSSVGAATGGCATGNCAANAAADVTRK